MWRSVPDPVPALKEQLARTIAERLEGWDLANGAALLRTDAAKLSRIRNGNLGEFSLQRLVRFLAILGDDVTIACTSWEERRVRARYEAAARRNQRLSSRGGGADS